MTTALDRFSRPLTDLRVSVTDRCNLRCPYCLPRESFGEGFSFMPRGELLSFEEITRVCRAFTALGVSKIRLTGGEPLLRRGLERLVAMLAYVDGIADLALTTNGTLLTKASTCARCCVGGSTTERWSASCARRGGCEPTATLPNARDTRADAARPPSPRIGPSAILSAGSRCPISAASPLVIAVRSRAAGAFVVWARS
jgi:hypothetical protein